MTHYYFIEDIDASLILIHMLQACSKYFPVPTVADGEELKQKLTTLNKLCLIFTDDKLNDSSYQSEIYKRICEMFVENVIRHSPSYTLEAEINTEMMWELKQLYPVYQVFSAFLNLKGFDEEKLAPYVGETFINTLIRRMDCSCMETERDCVKLILFLLFEKALYLRRYILQSTINSLIDYKYTSINVQGINELLELFKAFMCHRLVESPMIAKVLSPLFKHSGLCHYADQLLECFETAVRVVDVGLGACFVKNAIDHWSASAADVPSLCRTLGALYFEVCGPEARRQTRYSVVSHVVGRLLMAATAYVDGTTVAACRAYAEFCGRLIDDVVVAAKEEKTSGVYGDLLDRVAEGLIAVHRNHRNYNCVDLAGRLLRRLIGGERCLVGNDYRVAALKVLVEDRPRTMTEHLVDNTF